MGLEYPWLCIINNWYQRKIRLYLSLIYTRISLSRLNRMLWLQNVSIWIRYLSYILCSAWHLHTLKCRSPIHSLYLRFQSSLQMCHTNFQPGNLFQHSDRCAYVHRLDLLFWWRKHDSHAQWRTSKKVQDNQPRPFKYHEKWARKKTLLTSICIVSALIHVG